MKRTTRLDVAINRYKGPKGPGEWTTFEDKDSFGLVYAVAIEPGAWPAPHSEMVQEDAAWKLWGGEEILAAAGLSGKRGKAFVEQADGEYRDGIIFTK